MGFIDLNSIWMMMVYFGFDRSRWIRSNVGYWCEFKLDNDRLIWVLSIDRDGFDRVWVIGAIDIRAEMEFRAHSKSYLKITTWVA
jgi:hypothetical protein